MEVWLDAVSHEAMDAGCRQGILFGITTNPSILSRSEMPLEEVIGLLLSAQPGPVAVQVTTDTAADMIRQGKLLFEHSPRIVVKVPVTRTGLEAIHVLTKAKIPTMATAIFHAKQMLAASLAGAAYVAPYVGAIGESGKDPIVVLQDMLAIKRNYSFDVKILGAALRTPEQLTQCAAIGLQAVTLSKALFNDLTGDAPETMQRLQRFKADWEQAKPSTSFLLRK